MSHELEINADGTANMIWTNEVPWHGLGTQMDPAAGAIEWMKAANLDWNVVKTPMFTTLPNGQTHTVVGKKGNEYSTLVRDHGTNEFAPEDVFGVVGPEWIPVQNSEVFSFMDKFCNAGNMTMETCGALKGGTEIWALARFADDFDVVKGDAIKGYLLFHSAHVWGKGNQIRLTPVRVVCNNTLTMAIGGNGRKAGTQYRMPHVRAFDAEVQQTAEIALGLASAQMEEFKEVSQFLASTPAKTEQVQEMIAKIYHPKQFAQFVEDKSKEPVETLFTHTTEGVWEAVNLAPGADLRGSKGSWWGALNGVTYFEDHMRHSLTDQSNVLGSAWFGAGAKRKTDAMALAMEYAKVA